LPTRPLVSCPLDKYAGGFPVKVPRCRKQDGREVLRCGSE